MSSTTKRTKASNFASENPEKESESNYFTRMKRMTESVIALNCDKHRRTSSRLYAPHGVRAAIAASIALTSILLLSIQTSWAASATWQPFPVDNDWNNPANWTQDGPPNGPADTATFATSSVTGISVVDPLPPFTGIEVNGITFGADASPFTIEIPYNGGFNGGLVISGTGITNNSSVTQSFLVHANLFLQNNAIVGNSVSMQTGAGGAGYVAFSQNATAGNGIFTLDPGTVEFDDDATAGNGVFILGGFTFCGSGAGGVVFYDTASAANGTFTVAGGAICGSGGGGLIYFSNNSTAGDAVFSLNGGTNSGERGAVVAFQGNVFGGEEPTAGNATLIAYGGSGGGSGGSIQFLNDSAGGTSRVEVFGNGNLDISSHVGASTSVTIGSIEGTGAVFLGGSNFTVGSNNLSTTFSGSIQDCGINCQIGGSLTKIGTGSLTLSGANTYTGVTTVSAGALLVTTRPSSGTGNNKVKVNAGTLGGTGVIGGAVTIGMGSGAGAFLAPGTTSTGTLTLKKTLTFKPDGTYKFELKANNRRSDTVAAKGVVINTGALFTFIGLGNGIIPQGTVFTAVNNTAATPISGRFSNLADGSTFTVGSNTYLVSYQGGTGNDLILTVQ